MKNSHNNQLSKSFLKSYLIFFILIVFSIIIIASVSFFSAKNALNKLGETALNNRIQMGLAMMDSLQDQVDSGKISKQDAQEIFKSKMLAPKKQNGKTRGLNSKLEMNISAYMYAINKDGIEVMHPFKEGENISKVTDENGRNLSKLIINEAQNHENDGIINFKWKNPGESFSKMKINSVAYFKPWGWYINVGCYKSDFYKPVYGILKLIIIISIALILISLAFIIILMKKKIKPLGQIVESMEMVSNGNMQVNLNINSTDEIGYIGATFNKMAVNIRNILIQIKELSETLNIKTTAINSFTDTTYESSNNVKKAMEQISSDINSSTKNIQNSFESIKFLAQNINEVRTNSISMKSESTAASDLNSNIINILTDLENKNSESINSSKDTNLKIEELLGKSNEIVPIINVIENISTEINLLSLNASIEAARAGDAGRGFAIVANQIKKLSNDTSNSVNKIRDLINDLISAINTSADSVKNSLIVAQSQVETITETKNTLNKVISFIQKIPTMINENVSKIDSIYKSSDLVTSSMNSVICTTEEISSSSEEITSSSFEVNNNMENIKGLVNELNQFSNKLKNSLDNFTI